MPSSACLVASLALITSFASTLDYTVENRGSWPESWPAELEPLREKSRTLTGPLQPQQHYAIRFDNRDEFEAAWPHLLKVKSSGAPIVLRAGRSFWLGEESLAGVCVHTPPEGVLPKSDSEIRAGDWEETNYLELIVDGEIVDLNRIQLPANTPIIDERFIESNLNR